MKPVIQRSLMLLTIALITACSSGSNNSTSDNNVDIPLTIPFAAQAGDVAIDCSADLVGLGTGLDTASIEDFRFYVHEVTLIAADDSEYSLTLDDNAYQGSGVALLDFQNNGDKCSGAVASTNKSIAGSISAPSDVVLTGIKFTLGVPEALNHNDPSSAPGHLNILGLHWNWQGGYKHLRMDVATDGGSVPSWNFHLGSTGCSPDPSDPSNAGSAVSCTRANRPVIELDTFDPASDSILVDYAELVANSDIGNDTGGAPGCMSGQSDPECAALFSKLGMDITLNDSSEDYASGTQTVFSVM